MNTLIKKEIRLLLPAWIAAMVLAVLPPCFIWSVWRIESPPGGYLGLQPYFQMLASIVPLVFTLGVLLLGISSFGQELNSGCFGVLLSQPAERRRIWFVKVITLAIAFTSVLLTTIILTSFVFAVWNRSIYDWYYPNFGGPALPLHLRYDLFTLASLKSQALEFLALSALVTFSGALWTTLLLRQTTGAFWFTLLTPLAIVLGLSMVLQDWMQTWNINFNRFIVVALVLYSIAGFFWAWRLFMRAQDIQWGGGEISLPWRGKISGAKIIPVSTHPRHWLATLTRKEVQLHQASLIIAAVLLVLHLACALIRKTHPHFEGPDLKFIVESFWILWLLMPLLIGATAIAEERRIGVLESQLCAPVSRRAQLFIKFSAALALSLVLGAVVPLLIEGTNVLNGGWLFTSTTGSWLFAAAAGTFFVAFYASSLARATLQAIGYAMFFAVVIYWYEAPAWPGYPEWFPYGLVLLKRYLTTPILLLATMWLIYWNFKRLHQNHRLWLRNVIVILVAYVSPFILAGAIYFRPWELLLPLEPRGPVRIHDSAQVKFETTWGGIYAISPDHRLWVESFDQRAVLDPRQSAAHSMVTVFGPGLCYGQFIGGSNWVDVAVNEYATVAIQSDGTLWAIKNTAPPFILTQIGRDTNWSRVASGQDGFLLLKNDDSLWRWGARIYVWRKGDSNPQIKQDMTSLPVRVSDKTNWTGLYSPGLLPHARNSEGGKWMLVGNRIAQETNEDNQWSMLTFIPSGPISHLEVKTNGELWFCEGIGEEHSRKIQLGQGMKWKAATFGTFGFTQTITAIRSDGTLWAFQSPLVPGCFSATPRQLGYRSDWVALASGIPLASGYALASDGSIWDWDPRTSFAWLAPSRRPLCLGNIFEGAPAIKN